MNKLSSKCSITKARTIGMVALVVFLLAVPVGVALAEMPSSPSDRAKEDMHPEYVLYQEIQQALDAHGLCWPVPILDMDDWQATIAFWKEIRESPDAVQQLLDFWEARPRFWYEFREDEVIYEICIPYPIPDYVAPLTRCWFERAAEQLPEYPIMEFYEKLHEWRQEAVYCPHFERKLQERCRCPDCAEKQPSAERVSSSPFPGEPEPVWWGLTHHSTIHLLPPCGFVWYWRFRTMSESFIRWPGVPACHMRVQSALFRDGERVSSWQMREAQNTRRVRVLRHFPLTGSPPGNYQTTGMHCGYRTGHDEWNNVWTDSPPRAWPP